MGVADVGVARDDRLEHGVGVGLAQDAQRGLGVDGGVRHGVEEAGQRDLGVEVLAHFLDGLADLDDGVQLEVARRHGDEHPVRGGEGVDGEPGERRRLRDDERMFERDRLCGVPGMAQYGAAMVRSEVNQLSRVW